MIQRQGMVVCAGNGRLIAAKAMGWTHIAALVVDESDVEAVSFSLADNRTSDLSTFDDEALTALLQSLPADLMEVTGFNSEDFLFKGVLQTAQGVPVDESTLDPCPACGRGGVEKVLDGVNPGALLGVHVIGGVDPTMI